MSLALSSLAIAVLAAVLYALFQKSAPTFSLLVSMAAALILLARVGSAAQSVLSGLVRLEQRTGGDAYCCLLRCTGIVLLTDYARTLCEEAGAESLAWCAALAGRLLVLAAAWPLLEEIGQRIWSVLGRNNMDSKSFFLPFFWSGQASALLPRRHWLWTKQLYPASPGQNSGSLTSNKAR